MITPKYLQSLPDAILELYAQAEIEILADMARRISAYDYWIPAADYQNQKLREAGVVQRDIIAALSKLTGKTQTELKRMMTDATTTALKGDMALYDSAGITTPKIADSVPLRRILNAGYKATANQMQNITRTTARTATQQFTNALDRAWLKISSGAFDAESSIRSAVQELAEAGIQAVRYPSGRSDSIEVAVRRATLTGVNQTAAQLQMELAKEVGCDLVEVSAHSGARPEHAAWQGRVFSISGKHTKYPSFTRVTGYGTGAGLCGWNCRHTFGPYVEGASTVWTEEELAALDEPTYEYNGKKMTEYEAEQQQRYNERQIRRWKREASTLDAAGLDSSAARAKVKDWQARQRDYLSKTGLQRQYGRESISFTRKPLTNANVYGSLKSSNSSNDFFIGRSVGAKAKNYDVLDLETGEFFHFVEGSIIQNTEVFAGKGTRVKYRIAEKYAELYGGNPDDWQHVKGYGVIDYHGEERNAEVHWSQCADYGKHDFFIKRWED
jgi:hypothetical protein